MKKYLIYAFVIFLFSCNHVEQIEHRGMKKNSAVLSDLDSVLLVCDSISWNGNFFALDSNICFADSYYSSLYIFDKNTGKLKLKRLGKGHATNEIIEFIYAYPLQGVDQRVVIIDSSKRMFIYNMAISSFEYQGFVDMGWDNPHIGDYDSPSVYNIMELADCGVDFYETNRNEVLIPLSFVNRNLGRIDEKRYKYGHTWCVYNYDMEKIVSLSGHYPPSYIAHPAMNYENFRYLRNDGKYFVCYAADSLIYVYDDLEHIQHSFGFDAIDADRTYTEKYVENGFEYLEDDLKRVSVNAGLVYNKDYNCILRVTWNKILSEDVSTSLQLYDCNSFDLIAERKIPGCIQFLLSEKNMFYGINVLSKTEEDLFFVYKLQMDYD